MDLSIKKKWKDLVNKADKKEVPINLLDQVGVQLIDSTLVYIDVKCLLEAGQTTFEIEDMLDARFNELGDYIESVDFYIDVDKVANQIQPKTNALLKHL